MGNFIYRYLFLLILNFLSHFCLGQIVNILPTDQSVYVNRTIIGNAISESSNIGIEISISGSLANGLQFEFDELNNYQRYKLSLMGTLIGNVLTVNRNNIRFDRVFSNLDATTFRLKLLLNNTAITSAIQSSSISSGSLTLGDVQLYIRQYRYIFLGIRNITSENLQSIIINTNCDIVNSIKTSQSGVETIYNIGKDDSPYVLLNEEDLTFSGFKPSCNASTVLNPTQSINCIFTQNFSPLENPTSISIFPELKKIPLRGTVPIRFIFDIIFANYFLLKNRSGFTFTFDTSATRFVQIIYGDINDTTIFGYTHSPLFNETGFDDLEYRNPIGSFQIVIDRIAPFTTFTHEIGHILSLHDSDNMGDAENIMHTYSRLTYDSNDSRKLFTIGQIFRMNKSTTSFFNINLSSAIDDNNSCLTCPYPNFNQNNE